MDERLKKQLDFSLEIDKEKNVFRQTHLSGYGRNENDAEHAWHMPDVHVGSVLELGGSWRVDDGSESYISLNLRNLEYPAHSNIHVYALENLGKFRSYAENYLKEDE
jgi:hypothetical protein